MRHGKNTLLLAIMFVFLSQVGAAFAQEKKAVPKESNFRIDAMFDAGISTTSYPLVLRKDWRDMFVPEKQGMKPSSSNYPLAWGFRFGISTLLVGKNQSFQVRMPISFRVIGLNLYKVYPKLYLAKEGVAGTNLNWWDFVMVNDIVVEHYTPRIGIEFVKGKFALGISAQHYRLVARDFLGKDCYGCQNHSSVISTRQLESGISPRVDIFFMTKTDIFTEGVHYGIFFEMAGPKTFSIGLTGRWINSKK